MLLVFLSCILFQCTIADDQNDIKIYTELPSEEPCTDDYEMSEKSEKTVTEKSMTEGVTERVNHTEAVASTNRQDQSTTEESCTDDYETSDESTECVTHPGTEKIQETATPLETILTSTSSNNLIQSEDPCIEHYETTDTNTSPVTDVYEKPITMTQPAPQSHTETEICYDETDYSDTTTSPVTDLSEKSVTTTEPSTQPHPETEPCYEETDHTEVEPCYEETEYSDKTTPPMTGVHGNSINITEPSLHQQTDEICYEESEHIVYPLADTANEHIYQPDKKPVIEPTQHTDHDHRPCPYDDEDAYHSPE